MRYYKKKKNLEGVIKNMERRWKEKDQEWQSEEIERLME